MPAPPRGGLGPWCSFTVRAHRAGEGTGDGSHAGPGRSQLGCQGSGWGPFLLQERQSRGMAVEPRGRGAGAAAATQGLWRGQSTDRASRNTEGRRPSPATTDYIDRTRLGGLRHGVWAPTQEDPDIQVFFENRGRKSTVVLKKLNRTNQKPDGRAGGRGPQ